MIELNIPEGCQTDDVRSVIVSTIVTAPAGAARKRGPNRQPAWSRDPDGPVSVLRLPLDVTDPVARRQLAAMFDAAYSVRRAVQRDARDRCRAYWAAHRERAVDPSAVRARLGLTKKALEHAAYRHVDAAPHLRRALTKAVAMNIADGVWAATERHLFRDASGKTFGMPRVGRWHDFTRIPGRAQSHTKPNKWESFRLHGSLTGHRAAYAGTDGGFFQPRHLRTIAEPAAGWWHYTGPLAVVFTGLAVGTLILPVRLPAAPANQPILDHHLADPSRWHKIDLIRHRDPTVIDGWRYEAHLMVLIEPYVAPAIAARRATAAVETAGRSAGIDVNVSNITVASHDGAGGDLQVTRVVRDAAARAKERDRARAERRRARKLERSRRAANPDQFELSDRQLAHVARCEAAGRQPRVMIPKGPRKTRSDGKPSQAYRHDHLSIAYRRERAAQAADAAATAQARVGHAREVARELIRDHGCCLTVEDCNVGTWGRRWGRSIAAFTPSTLLAAIEREADAVARIGGGGGGVARADTRTTALSQHCLCGARVDKPLGVRIHRCDACGLLGDRDAIAATLAAFVVLASRAEPTSATVDYATARASARVPQNRGTLAATIPDSLRGRQDAPSESTAHTARDRSSVAGSERSPGLSGWLGELSARHRGQPRMSLARQTTSDRSRLRTDLSHCGLRPLRDSS